MMVELLYALGDGGAALPPHTGTAVRARCCRNCCARLVMLGLQWRPIPELLSAFDVDGAAVRVQ